MSQISITDHALLRYIERVQGVDLDKLRDHIRREIEPAVKMKAKNITIDGFIYHLSGAVLKTVSPGWKHKRTPR